jgi:hypothetical protein
VAFVLPNFFDSVNNEQSSVFVEVTKIAGFEESLVVDCRCGGFGVVAIALVLEIDIRA